MQLPTADDIINELQKQQVAEKYLQEGISIIQSHMDIKNSTLEDAVKFLLKWIAFNEM
jgi:hypothetical protein